MGTINFKKEPAHLKRITSALQRRGMRPDTKEEWEIHGPHEGMNYQVYVGYAISQDDSSDSPLVAIYPRAVYEIEDRSDWGRVQAEQKIQVDA